MEVTDHEENTKKFSLSRYGGALYIPGYIVDGTYGKPSSHYGEKSIQDIQEHVGHKPHTNHSH